jgi:hypothetical protein
VVMTHTDIFLKLQALERELHAPKVRGDSERLAELLRTDFLEFGRSGRTYTRPQIFELLLAETTHAEVQSQDFKLVQLSKFVCLLTYRSARVSKFGALEDHANRSSVWRDEEHRWQMVFHLGTPTSTAGSTTQNSAPPPTPPTSA